jgi:cytochrome c553
MKLRPRWIVYGLVGLAVAVPLAAVLVAWSGVYNVAASSGHLRITDIFLRFGMEHSVRARAPNVTPPALDNPDLIRLGAGHFHSGCAYCHGAPGIAIPASARHMLPPPPDLKSRVGEWSDQELFWIVKHGIKYAGMPAWPTQQRDDEVWTLVAFLRALPALDPAGYRALAFGDLRLVPPTGAELATGRAVTDPVGACARCHGAEDRLPTSGLAPRLHGQPAEMLLSALEAYAKGDRKSGIMQQIAAELNPDARGKLSTYYAGLPPPAAQTVASNGSVLVERGRNLAMKGDPAAQIPACEGCHGPAALPAYPRLAGQNAPYIAGQLRLWQRGDRGNTALNAIMEPIARRLGEHQINEVAAYYAGVPAGTAAALPPPVQKAGQP